MGNETWETKLGKRNLRIGERNTGSGERKTGAGSDTREAGSKTREIALMGHHSGRASIIRLLRGRERVRRRIPALKLFINSFLVWAAQPLKACGGSKSKGPDLEIPKIDYRPRRSLNSIPPTIRGALLVRYVSFI